MPKSGSDDINWKQLILEMHGDVKYILPRVRRIDRCMDDHERRIRALELIKERKAGETIGRKKFYEKHPFLTTAGGIGAGGVSLTVLFKVMEWLWFKLMGG